jgi:photosystem II stability/assembly factor-like uncharacterized protein
MKRLCYLLLLFFATNASAQYVSNGPEGGAAYNFYQEAGRTWLAANAGVFYSDDQGQSWEHIPISRSIYGCDSLISIAAFGNDVYAGAMRSGIYYSPDRGATWNLVNANLPKSLPYTDLEISGQNVLTIRGDSGILYRSPDRGINWIRMDFALHKSRAYWISVSRNNVYVSTSMGLFQSMDNGLTFNMINGNPDDAGKVVWVNDTAYVGTADGLRRSTDDGASFTIIGLSGQAVSNVAVSGKNIYAAVRMATGRDSVLFSSDGGATFGSSSFPTAKPFNQVHDMMVSQSQVLLGTSYGIYRSSATSTSGSFVRSDSGFISTLIRSFSVNGLRLYTATFPMGIYYTPDSADNWIHNGDMAHGLENNMLSVDAKNQYVHAGGQSNYYRSSDFGVTWTVGATGLPAGRIHAVLAAKGTPNVYALRNGNLFHSSNDGTTFSAVATGLPVGSATHIIQADTAIFIVANGSLYKGSGLLTFSPVIGLPGQVTSVVYKGATFYAGTAGNGLYRSSDGNAWGPVMLTPADTLPGKINALAVNGNALIAGTDDGLFMTDSMGVWTKDSLEGKVISALAVMNNKVYAGTCGGVWSLKNLPSQPPTGIAAIGNAPHALQVYPNPASGDFRAVFIASTACEGTLTLRDLMGHTVLRQSFSLRAGRNELPVAASSLDLPAGIYLVQVSAGSEVAAQRVVIR